jgi:hypothetical protein
MSKLETDRTVEEVDTRRDDYDRDPLDERVGRRDRDRDGPRVMMVTRTETRNAFLTTEFWLALVTSVAVVVAGYWDEGQLLVAQGWALGCGVMGLYVLSRGIAKAGSHSPTIRELD